MDYRETRNEWEKIDMSDKKVSVYWEGIFLEHVVIRMVFKKI